MKAKRKMEGGFSLIEVTIALCILSFGILSLFLLVYTGIRGNTSASHTMEGVNRAITQVEGIIGSEYDGALLKDLAKDGESCAAADHCLQEANYDIFWNIQTDYPIANLKTIHVFVEYSLGHKNRVEFEYIKPGTI